MSSRHRDSVSAQTRTVALLLLVAALVVAVGTIGYMLIEGWSFLDALYMTMMGLTTVGYGEVHLLTPRGEAFTVGLIVVGVVLIGMGLRSLVEYMVSGTLTGVFRRRTMRKQVAQLRGHYLICGFGRVGESVAKEFAEHHAAFVVVENDPAPIVRIAELGYPCVEGDASLDETLLEAGIAQAKGLVAAVDSDADNIYVVLSARVLNPDLTIIARAGSEESAGKLRRAGADRVISPYSIGGKKMATLMMKPLVSDYLEVVSGVSEIEFRLEEFALDHTCEVVGRSIGALDIRRATGATVLAVRRGSTGIFDTNPSPDLVLEHDDVLIAIGTQPDIKKLEELFACRIPANAPGATVPTGRGV